VGAAPLSCEKKHKTLP